MGNLHHYQQKGANVFEASAVYKYTLRFFGVGSIPLPIGSKPLSVGFQDSELVIWVVVNPSNDRIIHHQFAVLPTGRSVSTQLGAHVGTVTSAHGFVYHVFDQGEIE